MNLFDRFARVAKANLNDIANKLEDPEKIMDQAIEEMQNDLVKIRQSYAEVTATQRRLLKQKEQCDAMAQDWYKRAQLALEKGNDDLAKEALSRRQQQTRGQRLAKPTRQPSRFLGQTVRRNENVGEENQREQSKKGSNGCQGTNCPIDSKGQRYDFRCHRQG